MADKPKFVRLDLEPFGIILKSMNNDQIAEAMKAVYEYCDSGREKVPDIGDISALAFNFLKNGVDEGWSLWRTNQTRNEKMQSAKSSRHRDDIVTTRNEDMTTSSRKQILNIKEENIKEEKEKKKKEDKSSLSSELDFDALKSYWNNQVVNRNSTMRQITYMSDKRKSAIRARLREYNGDKKIIQQAIDNAMSSDFLNGKNDKNWIADFDWIFKPNNFNKVIEGNYCNKEATASSNSSNPYANYDFSKYFVNDGKQ